MTTLIAHDAPLDWGLNACDPVAYIYNCSDESFALGSYIVQLALTLITAILVVVIKSKYDHYIKGPLRVLLQWRIYFIVAQFLRGALAVATPSFGPANAALIVVSVVIMHLVYFGLVTETAGAFTRLIPAVLVQDLPTKQQRFCVNLLYQPQRRRILLACWAVLASITAALAAHYALDRNRVSYVASIRAANTLNAFVAGFLVYVLFVIKKATLDILDQFLDKSKVVASSSISPSERKLLTTRLTIAVHQIKVKIFLLSSGVIINVYNASVVYDLLARAVWRAPVYVVQNILYSTMQWLAITIMLVTIIKRGGDAHIFADDSKRSQGSSKKDTRGNASTTNGATSTIGGVKRSTRKEGTAASQSSLLPQSTIAAEEKVDASNPDEKKGGAGGAGDRVRTRAALRSSQMAITETTEI